MNSRRKFLSNLGKGALVAGLPVVASAKPVNEPIVNANIFKVLSTHKASGYTLIANRFGSRDEAAEFIDTMTKLESTHPEKVHNEYTIIECLPSDSDEKLLDTYKSSTTEPITALSESTVARAVEDFNKHYRS